MAEAEVIELAGKVEDVVRSTLGMYRLRFVDLDELARVVEGYVRREAGLDCYYYVDEYPTTESREFYKPDGIRFDVEEAVDSVRCTIDGRELDLVYVRMRRGIVELANGKQFWLIVDVEPYVNEDLVKELGGER
jgi:hypothetical protein